MRPLTEGCILLAGLGEVRVVGSAGEAASALDGGFRPAVVVLGAGVRAAAGDALARSMERHPAQATIPVLALTVGADEIRLRLVSRHAAAPPAAPEQLAGVLAMLEDFMTAAPEGVEPSVVEPP